MTAGRGITHSERFEKARAIGDHLEGIQAWVALPEEDEECDPAFTHLEGDALPVWTEAGVSGQLIAGSAFGLTAGAPVFSPMFYVALTLAPGSTAELPSGYSERALYIVQGTVELDGRAWQAGQMLVLGAEASAIRSAGGALVMVLGGEPVGERFLYWNFVSSRQERIAEAAADWRAGRMKLPDLDDGEFIPLPDDPGLPAHPLS